MTHTTPRPVVRPVVARLPRGAVRRSRRLPSRSRSRRFRRGLEQPVGAGDEGAARLRLLRARTSAEATSRRYGRELRGTPAPATTSASAEHVAVNEDIAMVLDQYEAQWSGREAPGAFRSCLMSTCSSAVSRARTTRSRRPCARRTASWARRASSGGRSTGSCG